MILYDNTIDSLTCNSLLKPTPPIISLWQPVPLWLPHFFSLVVPENNCNQESSNLININYYLNYCKLIVTFYFKLRYGFIIMI